MVMTWYRQNKWAALLVTLIRLYIGWQWLDAGIRKLTDGFDATGFLKGAVAKPVVDHATEEAVYPNYIYFLNHFAIPNAKLINVLIPIGEFLIGVGLIVGGLTRGLLRHDAELHVPLRRHGKHESVAAAARHDCPRCPS